MKKIINGKKYDTETAQLINKASWLERKEEAQKTNFLYRKSNGEFFIHHVVIDSYDGKFKFENLLPITEEKAKKQAEFHMSVEEYEAIFGEVQE